MGQVLLWYFGELNEPQIFYYHFLNRRGQNGGIFVAGVHFSFVRTFLSFNG